MVKWTHEAIELMPEEEDEDEIIKNKIKNHERKSKAFEKETFDVFDYNEDEELENEDNSDRENSQKDSKTKMWRSCTNGFFKRKEPILMSSSDKDKNRAFDD